MSTTNTQTPSVTSLAVERIAWGRLWLSGLAAIIASVIVNMLIATVTLAFLPASSHAMQLQVPVYTTFTVIGALGAVLIFALLGKLSRRPVRLYRIIASVVLVISFVPDFLLLPAMQVEGIVIGALIVMHIATYLITVGMLTTISRAK